MEFIWFTWFIFMPSMLIVRLVRRNSYLLLIYDSTIYWSSDCCIVYILPYEICANYIHVWYILKTADSSLVESLRQEELDVVVIHLIQQSWKGVYWFHLVRLSVHLSVHLFRLSICVCSVFSTILVGSISYLHILSSNVKQRQKVCCG